MYEEKREANGDEAARLPLMPKLPHQRPERLLGWPYGDIDFVGNRRHEGFGVVAFRAFESP
jgi:hypothetical protein